MSNLKLIQQTKKCITCKEDLLFSFFNKNKATKDKLQSVCRECDCKRQAKRRVENYKELQDYAKEYRKKHFTDLEYRLQGLLNASKARAKTKNREHTITKQDLIDLYPIDGKCPIFGFTLEWNEEGFRETSPSIDRIDSTKGYTKDNIQIISWKANRIKGYASIEDLEILLSYLKQGE
jgi:DNA-directed RNA polymerase subunit RPC12/RpoP